MARRLDPANHENRKAMLAQLVADGAPLHHAGQAMLGLTKGQTARLWSNIKADLGEQAR